MDLVKISKAISVAIAVLSGEAGGYTAEDKDQARLTLTAILPAVESTAAATVEANQ
jgi:hypothetical protein